MNAWFKLVEAMTYLGAAIYLLFILYQLFFGGY